MAGFGGVTSVGGVASPGGIADIAGAGQTLLAGHEKEKMAKFQRDQIAINRNVSKQIFEAKERDFRKSSARQEAAARVAASGSGVDYTRGSFAAVAEDQMLANELEALNIRYRGELADTQFQNQWNLKDFEKDQLQRDKILDTGTSLLKAAG